MRVDYKPATVTDAALLGSWNAQLILDERHGNRMTAIELEARMRGWLAGGTYRAVIFHCDSVPAGYALFGSEPDASIYLRQFFICREHRRKGIGTAAMELLIGRIFPPKALLKVVVLAQNEAAQRFWASLGFHKHALILERPGK